MGTEAILLKIDLDNRDLLSSANESRQRLTEVSNDIAEAFRRIRIKPDVDYFMAEMKNATKQISSEFGEEVTNAYIKYQEARVDYINYLLNGDRTNATKFQEGLREVTEMYDQALRNLKNLGVNNSSSLNLFLSRLDDADRIIDDLELKVLRLDIQSLPAELKNIHMRSYNLRRELENLERVREKVASKQGGIITAEQEARFENMRKILTREIVNSEIDVYRTEFQAMQEYLKNYGSYQQQKLAITEDYAERIRNASSEGERLSLERERDNKLSSIETAELKNNMNWSAVFGEFGGMFEGMMRPVLEDAKEYIKTDEFKNSDQASQQALIEAIQQMEQSLGGAEKVSFEKLGTEIKAYQTAMLKLRQAQSEYKSTYEALVTAQKNYEKTLATGTEEEKNAAAEALRIARKNEAAASQNIQTLQTTATEAQNTMTQTATTLKTSMNGVVSGLQKIASGSLSGAYEGMIELGKNAEKLGGKLGEVFGKVADKLESVPILGWIVTIIDIFKDGISIVIRDVIDAVFNAVSGIIGDILSGDLFKTIGESLLRGAGKLFDTITWGGFSSWFGVGGNEKEVAETINRLTDRNELLTTAIESLTEEMKASRGTKSVKAYREAYDHQSEVNENYLQMAMAQAGYHNSHHSWNYYWGGFTADEIKRVSEAIGRPWDGSLWSLSPEEMKVLQSFPDIWERIQNTGKGGYGERLTDKLQDYIDQAGKLEELQNQLYEGLTGMSFDSMYDSFVDSLMDMEYDAKDAADDISEYFAKAMLSNKIGELMADDLEAWWEKFGAAMEDDGTLDEGERDALLEEYLGYMDEAARWRDEIFAATGYSGGDATSQDSSKKGYATASQDSIDELNGRTTGIQMAVESIRVQNGLIAFDVRGMREDLTVMRQQTDEMRGLALTAVNYLADISRNTHQLYEMNERLDKIEKNTRNL